MQSPDKVWMSDISGQVLMSGARSHGMVSNQRNSPDDSMYIHERHYVDLTATLMWIGHAIEELDLEEIRLAMNCKKIGKIEDDLEDIKKAVKKSIETAEGI